jgi:hypothetical protein
MLRAEIASEQLELAVARLRWLRDDTMLLNERRQRAIDALDRLITEERQVPRPATESPVR